MAPMGMCADAIPFFLPRADGRGRERERGVSACPFPAWSSFLFGRKPFPRVLPDPPHPPPHPHSIRSLPLSRRRHGDRGKDSASTFLSGDMAFPRDVSRCLRASLSLSLPPSPAGGGEKGREGKIKRERERERCLPVPALLGERAFLKVCPDALPLPFLPREGRIGTGKGYASPFALATEGSPEDVSRCPPPFFL